MDETTVSGKDLEILTTNLKPSFWRKLKSILRQNKKTVLLQFLFGIGYSYQGSIPDLDGKIQNLQNQVNSLQQKLIELEKTQTLNLKNALSGTLEAPDATRILQQGDSTLKHEQSPQSANLFENDSEVRNPTYQQEGIQSKSVSDASKSPLSQQYNIPSNQKKGLNEHNFITLSQIPEQEKIEIIQKGFQFNQQGKISLKNYYESTQKYSLFQFKGYNMKYESIRRNKLYQNLKE